MSRFVQGNCVRIMATFPDNAVDFILTDPPYLVGFRDRSGRSIAGDKTDEWLQPASNEMYRADRFIAAWKAAGFRIVGHLVFTKTYSSKAAYVGYRHECAYLLAKGRPLRRRIRCRTCWDGGIPATGITRLKNRFPACNRSLSPSRIPALSYSIRLPAAAPPAWLRYRPGGAISVSSCLSSTTGRAANALLRYDAP